MNDWIDFNRWSECQRWSRPGYVFEVINSEGQSLLTPCVKDLERPWDWSSAPIRFRVKPEPKPRRSQPLPKPERL
jgi:hypothetical protein